MTLGKIGTLVFYISLFALASLALRFSKKKKFDIALIIAILIPTLIAGLRSYVGTDFENYTYIYDELSKLSFGDWFGKNFMTVDGDRIGMWIVASIAGLFKSWAVFFAILGFLTALPAALFIKDRFDEKKYFLPYFFFLLTLFASGLNVTKQAIAISFVILSLKYVFSRKFPKFLLCVLIAASFHISALVAIILYFVYAPENTDALMIIRFVIFGCAALAVLLADPILKLLGGRFAAYVSYSGEISNKIFFLKLALLIVFCFFRKNCVAVDRSYDTLLYIYLLGVTLLVLGFTSPYVKRIADYFTSVEFLLLLSIPSAFAGKGKAFATGGVTLYEAGMFVLTYFVLGQSGIVPYSFIF